MYYLLFPSIQFPGITVSRYTSRFSLLFLGWRVIFIILLQQTASFDRKTTTLLSLMIGLCNKPTRVPWWNQLIDQLGGTTWTSTPLSAPQNDLSPSAISIEYLYLTYISEPQNPPIDGFYEVQKCGLTDSKHSNCARLGREPSPIILSTVSPSRPTLSQF